MQPTEQQNGVAMGESMGLAKPMVPANGRFDYVRYDEKAQEKQDEFKSQFKTLEGMAMTMLPPGRAQSLMLTALEESYMWVGKAIRDEQVTKRGADLQEGRCNS